MVCIKIRIYVGHRAEAQLKIGMLREPQDLDERDVLTNWYVYNGKNRYQPDCYAILLSIK